MSKEKLFTPDIIAALNTARDLAYRNAAEHGWYDGQKSVAVDPNLIGSKLMLMVSELSEAFEAYRDLKGTPYERNQLLTAVCQRAVPDLVPVGENGPAVKADDTLYKPDGFAVELADVVIRVFDLCGYLGIDLGAAIALKHEYNVSRPYKHGGKTV